MKTPIKSTRTHPSKKWDKLVLKYTGEDNTVNTYSYLHYSLNTSGLFPNHTFRRNKSLKDINAVGLTFRSCTYTNTNTTPKPSKCAFVYAHRITWLDPRLPSESFQLKLYTLPSPHYTTFLHLFYFLWDFTVMVLACSEPPTLFKKLFCLAFIANVKIFTASVNCTIILTVLWCNTRPFITFTGSTLIYLCNYPYYDVIFSWSFVSPHEPQVIFR